MSALTNVWRQLVQRRLWPVAIILIAALAAVPLVLAEQPEPAKPAQPVTVGESGETELATQPIVAPATPADRAKRRKVLGKSKNPFGVPRVDEAGSAAASNSNGSTTAKDPAPDNSPSSSGGDFPFPGGGATPVVPVVPVAPVAPVAPGVPTPAPKRFATHELTIRFGEGDSMDRMNVEKREALPIGEEPLVVYLGVEDGGRTAVFLVDSSIEPQGDGVCKPDPNTCETVELREGETEFFDIVDGEGEPIAQYQVDLLEIHGAKKRSTSGRTAAARAAGPGALQDRATTAGVARTADVGLALP